MSSRRVLDQPGDRPVASGQSTGWPTEPGCGARWTASPIACPAQTEDSGKQTARAPGHIKADRFQCFFLFGFNSAISRSQGDEGAPADESTWRAHSSVDDRRLSDGKNTQSDFFAIMTRGKAKSNCPNGRRPGETSAVRLQRDDGRRVAGRPEVFPEVRPGGESLIDVCMMKK